MTQNHLQSQHNPHKNIKGILHNNRQNNPKLFMEAQKTPNRQNNSEGGKKKTWRYHASEIVTKLQSHSNTSHRYVETQKIPNSQNNLEKEKQSWKYHSL